MALHRLRRAEQVEVFRLSIFALQTCYLVAYVQSYSNIVGIVQLLK